VLPAFSPAGLAGQTVFADPGLLRWFGLPV
jgi:hypothetical protein